mmetsp:Transcript_35868/g.82334  ORF Transcript_35868/g.82334 Transcript_35868/m.82334 type:complete len:471 (-) Transcript_35868:80-1492(-)
MRRRLRSWLSGEKVVDLEDDEEDDTEVLMAAMECMRRDAYEACLIDVDAHLSGYLAQRPECTYEEWIAEIHPENQRTNTRRGELSIDWRFYAESSDHRRMWNAQVDADRRVAPRVPPGHGGQTPAVCIESVEAHPLVEDGRWKGAIPVPPKGWEWDGNDLVGTAYAVPLRSGLVLTEPDARVEVILQLADASDTAASIMIGDGNIGLCGERGCPFVEGALFGDESRSLQVPCMRPNTDFRLVIWRETGQLLAHWGGRMLKLGNDPGGHLGEVRLRPHRDTMVIRALNILGATPIFQERPQSVIMSGEWCRGVDSLPDGWCRGEEALVATATCSPLPCGLMLSEQSARVEMEFWLRDAATPAVALVLGEISIGLCDANGHPYISSGDKARVLNGVTLYAGSVCQFALWRESGWLNSLWDRKMQRLCPDPGGNLGELLLQSQDSQQEGDHSIIAVRCLRFFGATTFPSKTKR